MQKKKRKNQTIYFPNLKRKCRIIFFLDAQPLDKLLKYTFFRLKKMLFSYFFMKLLELFFGLKDSINSKHNKVKNYGSARVIKGLSKKKKYV